MLKDPEIAREVQMMMKDPEFQRQMKVNLFHFKLSRSISTISL